MCMIASTSSAIQISLLDLFAQHQCIFSHTTGREFDLCCSSGECGSPAHRNEKGHTMYLSAATEQSNLLGTTHASAKTEKFIPDWSQFEEFPPGNVCRKGAHHKS